MKRTIYFSFLLLILSLPISINAQTIKEDKSNTIKIVSINTDVFYDVNNGIKRLLNAYKRLPMELYQINCITNNFEANIKKLKIEIQVLKSQNKPTQGKEYILEELKASQIKIEKERATFVTELEKIVIEPIVKDIGEKIMIFVKTKGYKIVLDAKSGSFICGETIDITKEFIEYYNSTNY